MNHSDSDCDIDDNADADNNMLAVGRYPVQSTLMTNHRPSQAAVPAVQN